MGLVFLGLPTHLEPPARGSVARRRRACRDADERAAGIRGAIQRGSLLVGAPPGNPAEFMPLHSAWINAASFWSPPACMRQRSRSFIGSRKPRHQRDISRAGDGFRFVEPPADASNRPDRPRHELPRRAVSVVMPVYALEAFGSRGRARPDVRCLRRLRAGQLARSEGHRHRWSTWTTSPASWSGRPTTSSSRLSRRYRSPLSHSRSAGWRWDRSGLAFTVDTSRSSAHARARHRCL